MNSEWTLALSHAVHEVFENLCFMVPVRPTLLALEPTGAPESPYIVLEVDFYGAERGVLRLTFPEAMIAPVAAAMLGDDDALPLSEQYDAVSELANVVCGNVLPLIAGERAVFDLASPRVIATVGGGSGTTFDAAAEVVFDDGAVVASIALGGSIRPRAS